MIDHQWQSGEFPLCTVNTPVVELAQRLGIPLAEWEEPGLGSATGFCCKLASGLLLLFEEFSHAREHLGATGPTVYVDASDLVEQGIDNLFTIVLADLGLSKHHVTWLQTDAGLREAEWVVQSAEARASRM